MNRDKGIEHLAESGKVWDVLIIGGGATGLGAAVEAVSRGYTTLLLEQNDFAKATSSRSTKLAHGGVRYLQQGDVKMVLHALRERGLMVRNAPHLAHTLEFVIPAYRWWEKAFYGIGLMVYDALSGASSLGHSRILGRAQTLARLPTVNQSGLRGGVLYTDGQFDDARLAVTLALTLDDLGGTALNYVSANGLLKQNGKISGVTARDVETGRDYEVKARSVLNATGIFTDSVRKFDNPGAKAMLSVSQGAHLVLDRSFLPGTSALMVPHTDDGRVLFAVPWHQHVIVGTTDIPTPNIVLEPKPMEEEIEFLLRHAQHYLARPVKRSDVLSAYAGLRPLVTRGHGEKTSALSRDHTVITSKSNLVTITGGKWTTYRQMGQDAVDHLEEVGGFPHLPSVTRDLRLHGYQEGRSDDPLNVYGSDLARLIGLGRENPHFNQPLHKRLPYHLAEVVWAVRYEMARTVEDVLSRRTRSLLLDARASRDAAPDVARILAHELGRDAAWEHDQIEQFRQLAENYIVS